MKKITLSILFLLVGYSVPMVHQEVPSDLEQLFTDSTLRQQVEKQFILPLYLHRKLDSIKANQHNAKLLELSHKYSRANLGNTWKQLLSQSEFTPVAIGPTLILGHHDIPNHLIEMPLVRDHMPNNFNEYQNVSRVPNWLVARNTLQAQESVEKGYDKEIAIPENMYFWDIRDITHPEGDQATKLSDRNSIVLVERLPLVTEEIRKTLWSNMSEKKKQAIKYLILNGKFWDISPSNSNFTTDERFAYLDTEQPNNSERKNFFAKSEAKELWNAHAGLDSLDKLLGYPFAKADDDALIARRNKLLAEQ
ncbi:hypothetical protein A3F06_04390 [candidate division TM6 bacterium RIFCSPHIGHO2_12_FULL_36_22]|nr:MAG: hypothetical protein A3F06_04390 [candidate division TM6 bacterium RIFCSPHIGHO2_12_FULL_36_22]